MSLFSTARHRDAPAAGNNGMKILLCIGVILFGISAVGMIVGPTSVKLSTSIERAVTVKGLYKKITLDPYLYEPSDLSSRETRIRVVNESAAEVRFQNVGTSCGCTSAKLETSALKPGEATWLDVKITAPSRPGIRSVQVRLKPMNSEPWVYAIEAPIYPIVAFSQYEIHLGNVALGDSASG